MVYTEMCDLNFLSDTNPVVPFSILQLSCFSPASWYILGLQETIFLVSGDMET